MQLTVCVWSANVMASTDYFDPSWVDIEAAIEALDGEARNDLYLCPDAANPETYLAVGGGDGSYVVHGCINNERFPTVVRPDGSEDVVELMVGGQWCDFPGRMVVDLGTAIAAA